MSQKICTIEEARERDRYAINELGIPSLQLMERAGLGVYETIIRSYSSFIKEGSRFLVLCGKGNNGGDGFVVARHLCLNGYNVQYSLVGGAPSTKDSMANLALLRSLSVSSVNVKTLVNKHHLHDYSIIIDAIYGAGFCGDVHDAMVYDLFSQLNSSSSMERKIIAVDIPSGLNADSGFPSNICLNADLTVVLDCMKSGFLYECAVDYVGGLELVDIGIP